MGRLGQYENQTAASLKLTKEEKTELIEKHANLVKLTAYRLLARLPNNDMIDDLISCGNIGLLEAIESYNPNLNIKFETFAKFRIRGAMLDEMRQRDWIPRSVRSKVRQLDKLYRKLSSELNRIPEDRDMAAALEMNLEEYYELLLYSQPAGMICYEDLVSGPQDEKNVLDFLEDRASPHPDLEVQMKEIKRRIIDALEELTEDEQMAMSLYYYEGLTLKEIAQVLKVTESRVSQIHGKALLKLNGRLDGYRDDIDELNPQEGS